MNCKDFESMIHEIVSRRAPDKTKQLEALDHAGRCLWCALRLDEETKLTESLQAFARTLDVQRAPARVEEALVQVFRERTLREGAATFWARWEATLAPAELGIGICRHSSRSVDSSLADGARSSKLERSPASGR